MINTMDHHIVKVSTPENSILYFKHTIGTKSLNDIMYIIKNIIKFRLSDDLNFDNFGFKLLDNRCWPINFSTIYNNNNADENIDNKLLCKCIYECDNKCSHVHISTVLDSCAVLDEQSELKLTLLNKNEKNKLYIEEKEFPNTDKNISIFITPLCGDVFTVHCNQLDTIANIKLITKKIQNINVNDQRLIYGGKQLNDDISLCDYGISDCSTLHLILRLRGGMMQEVSGRNGKYEPLAFLFYDMDTDEFINEI